MMTPTLRTALQGLVETWKKQADAREAMGLYDDACRILDEHADAITAILTAHPEAPVAETPCESEVCALVGPHAVTECCPTERETEAYRLGLAADRSPEASGEARTDL